MRAERINRKQASEMRSLLKSPWKAIEMDPEERKDILLAAKQYLENRQAILGRRLSKLKWADKTGTFALAGGAALWLSPIHFPNKNLLSLASVAIGAILLAPGKLYARRVVNRYVEENKTWRALTQLHNIKVQLATNQSA